MGVYVLNRGANQSDGEFRLRSKKQVSAQWQLETKRTRRRRLQ